jgi:SAM-dependent methyltransferase
MQVQERSDDARGQVQASAAEIYDEFFVPALFAQWPPQVLEAARVTPGQRILDVACGTGVLARAAARQVGSAGQVVGLVVYEGMLAGARRHAAGGEGRQGRAEALPFEAESFDAVLSQFGLMFFDDPRQSLREMLRVVRPGRRIAVAVWDSLGRAPGYEAMAGLLKRLFGEEIADALRAPYCLGDTKALAALCADAGLANVAIETLEGTARFPSIASWVRTDIKGWTLADRIDDSQYARLAAEAEKALRRFVVSGGAVQFAHPAHIVSAAKE